MRTNPQSRRVPFLHLEEHFRDMMSKSWSTSASHFTEVASTAAPVAPSVTHGPPMSGCVAAEIETPDKKRRRVNIPSSTEDVARKRSAELAKARHSKHKLHMSATKAKELCSQRDKG